MGAKIKSELWEWLGVVLINQNDKSVLLHIEGSWDGKKYSGIEIHGASKMMKTKKIHSTKII